MTTKTRYQHDGIVWREDERVRETDYDGWSLVGPHSVMYSNRHGFYHTNVGIRCDPKTWTLLLPVLSHEQIQKGDRVVYLSLSGQDDEGVIVGEVYNILPNKMVTVVWPDNQGEVLPQAMLRKVKVAKNGDDGVYTIESDDLSQLSQDDKRIQEQRPWTEPERVPGAFYGLPPTIDCATPPCMCGWGWNSHVKLRDGGRGGLITKLYAPDGSEVICPGYRPNMHWRPGCIWDTSWHDECSLEAMDKADRLGKPWSNPITYNEDDEVERLTWDIRTR